jgi:hypothetical protein
MPLDGSQQREAYPICESGWRSRNNLNPSAAIDML